jgi:hypothetical protein
MVSSSTPRIEVSMMHNIDGLKAFSNILYLGNTNEKEQHFLFIPY